MKQIHIAWIGFQRRQISMKPYFGFDVFFFPIERKVSKFRKLISYLKTSIKTYNLLKVQKPDVVWVQLPQTPLLWVCLLYKLLGHRDVKIIADCHNAMLRAPWNSLPFTQSSLNACDMVVVHNESLISQAVEQGINSNVLLVVEDPPAEFSNVDVSSYEYPRPWIVFPASFAKDEPIDALVQAAHQLEAGSILITGNTKNLKEQSLLTKKPANLHFLGFLSNQDFDSLIVSCDAVLALTIFDGIQLSVCGEAVGACKPLIVSDTPLLRKLYPQGTEFVQPTAESIASGIHSLMQRKSEAIIEMTQFKSNVIGNYVANRVSAVMSRLGL